MACPVRYVKWILHSPQGETMFQVVLEALLKRVLDPNKKVQETACSALATLEEDAQVYM